MRRLQSQLVPLMDICFAITGLLARHRMPQIRFLDFTFELSNMLATQAKAAATRFAAAFWFCYPVYRIGT